MRSITPLNDDEDPPEDPAEEAYLEAEAERLFAPLEGAVPADVLQMMREVFADAAAMHPETTRLRKRALGSGRVERSGLRVKDGATSEETPTKKRGRGR